MEHKKEYIAPTLTVVSFKPEVGFAGSGGLFSIFQDFGPDHDPGYNDNNQQSWNDNNNSLFGDW